MKLVFTLFLATLTFTLVKAQDETPRYSVQVGAFEKKVGTDYFHNLEGIYEEKSPYDIWYYYLPCSTKEKAEELKNNAIAKGYPTARVIDFELVTSGCSAVCSYVPRPPRLVSAKSVGPIFYDFDRSDLRGESTRMLDRLYSILYHNPSYNAEILANTDAKGSNEYNISLSQRRALAAINYLRGLGIAQSRLSTTQNGEEKPAAKNELDNGIDTEEGRQLNRRVDLIVKDSSGKILNEIIEPLNVPVPLQLTRQ